MTEKRVHRTFTPEFKYEKDRKAYLSAILDYGQNKIVGYKLSTRQKQTLVIDTFEQVVSNIFPEITMIHTARGSQYTSHSFK